MKTHRALRPPVRRHLSRHAGISLVELMISITIGLILISGVTALISRQSSTRNELEKSTRQIENGRYASQVLLDDIQHAGYYGEYTQLSAVPAALPDPCATTLSPVSATLPLLEGLPLPVQGYDSLTTLPTDLAACLPAANHIAGTDILVIRRVDTATTTTAASTAGQLYMQVGLEQPTKTLSFILGNGSAFALKGGTSKTGFVLTTKDNVTIASLRKYLTRIYFVSPCNEPYGGGSTCTGSTDDGGSPIPTLKRMELSVSGSTAAFSVVPLALGIENLQIDYGIDSMTAALTTLDGSPDGYKTLPADLAEWGNVVALRINLLARNLEKTSGYATYKKYSLGGAGTVGPYTDSYKRRVFSEVVRVVNQSQRRE